MFYSLFKSIIFQCSPEASHYLTLEGLRIANLVGLTCFYPKISLPRNLMGINFPNPVGLAAGLDKNGDYIEALASLGFGFIEIGTVTPKPQTGNPLPRLFRLIKEEALINRLGFNNKGLDYVVERLTKTSYKGILGVNVGKNRDTPIEKGVDDYALGFRRVAPFASYVTINISSPNTPGLRDLQHGDLLQTLLRTLKQEQTQQKKYVPLVVKIAPDLDENEIKDLASILLTEKIDGVIATNTTVSREGVEGSEYKNEIGGLSGKPLFSRSTDILKKLHALLQDKIPIIGCGGISSVDDAKAKMEAGASLIQLYTGLIYQGPSLITKIAQSQCKSLSPP